MRRGPARVAVEAVVEAVAVVEEAVTMSVVTATAITGPTKDFVPKRTWRSCRKTVERPADCVAAVAAPTAPTAMPTAHFGPVMATARTPM